MPSIACEQVKIFDPVVSLAAVDVVHSLSIEQAATKILFHDVTVFGDAPVVPVREAVDPGDSVFSDDILVGLLPSPKADPPCPQSDDAWRATKLRSNIDASSAGEASPNNFILRRSEWRASEASKAKLVESVGD